MVNAPDDDHLNLNSLWVDFMQFPKKYDSEDTLIEDHKGRGRRRSYLRFRQRRTARLLAEGASHETRARRRTHASFGHRRRGRQSTQSLRGLARA